MSGRGRGSRREGWRCPAPRYPEGGARPCRWRSPAGAPQPAATPAPTQAFGPPHLSNLAQAKHRDSVSDSHVSHPTSDCLSILPAPRRVKLHTCSTLASPVRPPYADPQGSHLSSPSQDLKVPGPVGPAQTPPHHQRILREWSRGITATSVENRGFRGLTW